MAKALKRFFASAAPKSLRLTGGEHKHLSQVLRLRAGEHVVVCTGDGYDYEYEIDEVRREETLLTFVEKTLNECDPRLRVSLFCAVLKGDKLEAVVQKATELGVSEIRPIITRYVQAHDRSLPLERLQRIALEAAKQCGRSTVPAVYAPVELSAQIFSDFDTVVFPYENAQKPALKETMRDITLPKTASVAVLVGSEGGFADDEVAQLEAVGIVPVTLGKRILRAETASVAVLSAVMYELGEWQ